jgi:hypothetical protein
MTETSPTLNAPMVDGRCTYGRCAETNVYRMVGYCGNCHTDPVVGLFTAGHEAGGGYSSPKCPVCGCRELHWRGLEDAEG